MISVKKNKNLYIYLFNLHSFTSFANNNETQKKYQGEENEDKKDSKDIKTIIKQEKTPITPPKINKAFVYYKSGKPLNKRGNRIVKTSFNYNKNNKQEKSETMTEEFKTIQGKSKYEQMAYREFLIKYRDLVGYVIISNLVLSILLFLLGVIFPYFIFIIPILNFLFIIITAFMIHKYQFYFFILFSLITISIAFLFYLTSPSGYMILNLTSILLSCIQIYILNKNYSSILKELKAFNEAIDNKPVVSTETFEKLDII